MKNIPNRIHCLALALALPSLVGCATVAETAITAGTLGLIEPDLDGYDNNISPWAINHSGPSQKGGASAPVTGSASPAPVSSPLPTLAAPNSVPREPAAQNIAPTVQPQRPASPPATAKTPAAGNDIYGVWTSNEGIYELNRDGTGTLTMESVNGNPGTLTTYFEWSHNPASGQFTYTITRMALTGSIADYDRSMNSTYTVPYKLTDRTLVISNQTFHR